jgi:hypothetical protein
MTDNLNQLLDRCLGNNSFGIEMRVASIGCLLGSALILLAIQFWSEVKGLHSHPVEEAYYLTLNKTVKGGILENLSQNGDGFDENEIAAIKELPGVTAVGSFTRNHFPVTLNIWPSGKIGLGAAARADLFFESIPDCFLDQNPRFWNWEKNASFVPIIVPKFYLDLWNFGLAPSRTEYPSLSEKTASSMPIEIFIGEDQSVRLIGKFVAFSKRINSVLVPEGFLRWANQAYETEDRESYFFLWDNGEIKGPPVSLAELRNRPFPQIEHLQVSPVDRPADVTSMKKLFSTEPKTQSPARLIVKLEDSPTEAFSDYLKELGYETSREFPQNEWLGKATLFLVAGLAGIGALVSLLSAVTFSSSFRLTVSQNAGHCRHLLHLGFSAKEISEVFIRRLRRKFFFIIGIALVLCASTKFLLVTLANQYGLNLPLSLGISGETLGGAILYSWIFLTLNYKTIRHTIQSFA